jgi:hypothetical protein
MLERLAARLHEHDDEPHDRLPQQRSRYDGECRDDVGGKLSTKCPAESAPHDRGSRDRETDEPDSLIVATLRPDRMGEKSHDDQGGGEDRTPRRAESSAARPAHDQSSDRSRVLSPGGSSD